jgi:hypothetical protein
VAATTVLSVVALQRGVATPSVGGPAKVFNFAEGPSSEFTECTCDCNKATGPMVLQPGQAIPAKPRKAFRAADCVSLAAFTLWATAAARYVEMPQAHTISLPASPAATSPPTPSDPSSTYFPRKFQVYAGQSSMTACIDVLFRMLSLPEDETFTCVVGALASMAVHPEAAGACGVWLSRVVVLLCSCLIATALCLAAQS